MTPAAEEPPPAVQTSWHSSAGVLLAQGRGGNGGTTACSGTHQPSRRIRTACMLRTPATPREHDPQNICSYMFRLTAHSGACHGGQCKVLKLQPLRSVSDPIRGQRCFLSCAQIGEIQEVTNQRIFPFCLGFSVPKNCSDLTFRWNQMQTRG